MSKKYIGKIDKGQHIIPTQQYLINEYIRKQKILKN
jgi:hypothetical protein